MANHELIELDHDPLEFLDGEGLATLVTPQGVAEVAKADDQEMAATLELHESIAGCINIVGPISLCYDKVGASSFKVCLKLLGLEAACATVGLNKCQTIQANVLLAKASIQVCLQGKCLTYKAQACYRTTPFSSWNCVNKNGTILCL
jgi:hypothetical protein